MMARPQLAPTRRIGMPVKRRDGPCVRLEGVEGRGALIREPGNRLVIEEGVERLAERPEITQKQLGDKALLLKRQIDVAHGCAASPNADLVPRTPTAPQPERSGRGRRITLAAAEHRRTELSRRSRPRAVRRRAAYGTDDRVTCVDDSRALASRREPNGYRHTHRPRNAADEAQRPRAVRYRTRPVRRCVPMMGGYTACCRRIRDGLRS